MERLNNKDIIIIGLAIFAIFFGAGSLIFPPYLGMTSGSSWFLGFICFFITDVGLAFVTIVAMMKGNGEMSTITGVIGRIPSTLINSIVLICIGPLFVVPRSSATSYEMTVVPIIPQLSQLVFSIIFFSVVLALSIRKSKIVDIVGKILTPLMVISLVLLIIIGIVSPIGDIGKPISNTVVKDGIIAGYQAMDVLGALTVSIIVMSTIIQRGYTEEKSKIKVALRSCIIAGILLFLVYGGLTYLGATVSIKYNINDVNQASLIVAITKDILGYWGVIVLGIIVLLATLTTGIGVSSAVATYFEDLTNGKLQYKVLITVIIVFSTFVSNFGITTIINIAAPILSIIYPTIITLIILSFFKSKILNDNVYKCSAIVSFIMGILSLIYSNGIIIPIITNLPFREFGFEWIIPTVIGGILGNFIKTQKPKKLNPNE